MGSGFTYSVVANDIPAAGRSFRIEVGEAERRELAAALGIPAVEEMTADITVRPLGRRTYRVRGEVRAVVVQTDVVTLEPVLQDVAETVDVTLMPAEGRGSTARPGPELVDPGEPDERELYHGGRIDLGVIVGEHVALGLDPYPRAAGVEFEGHIEHDSSDQRSPFAKLARLKNAK